MPPRVPRRVTVVATERVTPNMVRVVFGGPGLDGFAAGEFTDHYVKLQLPDPRDAGADAHAHVHRARVGPRAQAS